MNEQIKELVEQVVGPSRLHGGDFALMGNEQVKKFAELIVRECTNICEELGDKGLDGHYCVDKIKEHFGIQK